ncbi:hypothetical protein E2C01_032105 [Portunus trituberculatus]|uniref:Uncharacterized protein n=1 Tax=Portunus trituberculatus TaxID=210409 RepID=A0A5B7EZP4_PORTR|nr:hypothetical protein [Portunus trituberculatus]
MLQFERACLLKAGKWRGSKKRQNFLQVSDPIKLDIHIYTIGGFTHVNMRVALLPATGIG